MTAQSHGDVLHYEVSNLLEFSLTGSNDNTTAEVPHSTQVVAARVTFYPFFAPHYTIKKPASPYKSIPSHC